jgi:hypothetical protein
MTTARPQRLKIAGRRWAVQYKRRPEGNAYGLCDYDAHTITIRDRQLPIEEADTLIHETLHAIIGAAGIVFPEGVAEEQVVTAIASGLTGVLADNPRLLAHISNLLREQT